MNDNKNNFHINGFAQRLTLKQRLMQLGNGLLLNSLVKELQFTFLGNWDKFFGNYTIIKETKFSQEGIKRDREHNSLKQEWLYRGRREAYRVPPWLNPDMEIYFNVICMTI